jgi:4-amino-4-deoxy-L-arabinose transferase-like glycosyltransferase
MTVLFRSRAVWVILAVAILVRIGAAFYLGDTVEALPGTHDQISYDLLAQNVAAGKGFVFDEDWYPFTPANTPTAHWSFLYVLFLAGVYFLVGHHPMAARCIQAAVVGALMPWLIYRLGKRTFNRTVGLVGAAAISVYIYLVYYSATLMTEPFYIVALLWALDTLQRIGQETRQQGSEEFRRPTRWAELGLAWGIATLLRQQVLLLIPLLLAWLLWAIWGRIRLMTLLRFSALPLAIVAAFILPWTIRNAIVYDQFLPLNSNVGWALFAANHPQQGDRFEPLNLPPVPAELTGLNEAEMNERLTAEGIRFVLEEPGRFALQTLDRFRNYFRFWPERASSPIANVSRVLSFGLYLPFMLYGLFLSIRITRKEQRPQCAPDNVSLLYLYAATYSAIHLLSWAMHRYRLPVDAVMMVFVGLAWVDLGRRFLHRPRILPSME